MQEPPCPSHAPSISRGKVLKFSWTISAIHSRRRRRPRCRNLGRNAHRYTDAAIRAEADEHRHIEIVTAAAKAGERWRSSASRRLGSSGRLRLFRNPARRGRLDSGWLTPAGRESRSRSHAPRDGPRLPGSRHAG